MRIGIEARFLTHPQRGGFKTYTENLVSALAQLDTSDSFVLYVDRVPAYSALPRQSNFRHEVVTGWFPTLRAGMREQITLRRRVCQDSLDIMHFTCNTATVNPPVTTVVTLHDVIQLSPAPMPFPPRGLAAWRQWGIAAYSRWVIMRTARTASKLLTVSQFERAQVIECLGVAPEAVRVTHLAPNPMFVPASPHTQERWRSQAQARFGIRGKFILGIGYEPRKNIPLLMEAFARLAEKLRDVDLVVVAAEERRRWSFLALARQLGIGARATVLGSTSPQDLHVLFNLADLLVYPSERESFGLPPLEAMSCGCPVIAMNASSLPEILRDGALMVDGKDPADWAEAISSVKSDEGLRTSLIGRATERAGEFTWRRCAEQTLEAYHDAAKTG